MASASFPRSISPKKIAASRRNALRSTGPKTAAGKEKSKFNALKHGLLARHTVLEQSAFGENKLEFARLLMTLQQDLAPVGIMEGILVERIASCYWRLARAVRCETAGVKSFGAQAQRAERDTREEIFKDGLRRGDLSILERSLHGLAYLIDGLEECKLQVVQQGSLAPDRCAWLWKFFSEQFQVVNRPEDAGRPLVLNAMGKPMSSHELVNQLDATRDALSGILGVEERFDPVVTEDNMSKVLIPPDDALMQRLARYEVAIERAMFRALDELQRLQALRGRGAGPAVPPR